MSRARAEPFLLDKWRVVLEDMRRANLLGDRHNALVAAEQVERVQCEVYGQYVCRRNNIQPAAQQVERVQLVFYVGYV